MDEKIAVLLDSDPGNDIDDAVAMTYLLRQPRCELVGITIVTGDVQKRAAIAEVTCAEHGRNDIPIHVGRREVLVYGQGQPWVPQYEGIRHLEHSLDYKENEAVFFMRDMIRSRPNEIVLCSIGPLNNIGLLFALDPEIPFLIRGLYSMVGNFSSVSWPEWNVLCDPVGAQMTFATERPHHRIFGLNVTTKTRLSQASCEKAFPRSLYPSMYEMSQIWFHQQKTPNITFHDPLACACIFEPDLCEYDMGVVTLDRGTDITHFESGDGNDEVAVFVDTPAFFQHYFEVVGSPIKRDELEIMS